MKRVKARKDEVAGASNRGIEAWLKGMKNATVYEGHARFEGPQQVRVGDDLLEADRIFTILMGDEVELRRQFIETYADTVSDLDI